jgi:hypothetical protein
VLVCHDDERLCGVAEEINHRTDPPHRICRVSGWFGIDCYDVVRD